MVAGFRWIGCTIACFHSSVYYDNFMKIVMKIILQKKNLFHIPSTRNVLIMTAISIIKKINGSFMIPRQMRTNFNSQCWLSVTVVLRADMVCILIDPVTKVMVKLISLQQGATLIIQLTI